MQRNSVENLVLKENIDISKLIENYTSIVAQGDYRTKLEQELAKLSVIQSAHNLILDAINKNTSFDCAQNIKKEKNILKIILYYFFLLGGFAQQISGSYIYAYSFFALIPALTNFWLIIISIVYTVLDCVLFYAFQADLLKLALGVDFTSPDCLRVLETYEEQLRLILLMNEALTNVSIFKSNIGVDEYRKYVRLVQLFNQDLSRKSDLMCNYQESIYRKMFKYGMYAFGVLSTVAASYFTAMALLVAIGGGLVGTPIGWAIIGLLIISGLAFYYAMEGKSLFHLVNPDYTLFKDLQSKLSLFKNKWSDKLIKDAKVVEEILPQNSRQSLVA